MEPNQKSTLIEKVMGVVSHVRSAVSKALIRVAQSIGEGEKNPSGVSRFSPYQKIPTIDVRSCYIQGPISISKVFSHTQKGDKKNPLKVSAGLTHADQNATGPDRCIYHLSISGSVTGDTPGGVSPDAFVSEVLAGARMVVLVGGIPVATFSTEQLLDTKFIQRGLDIEIIPDPFNFPAVEFMFEKNNAYWPELPADKFYDFLLKMTIYWSAPNYSAAEPACAKPACVEKSE